MSENSRTTLTASSRLLNFGCGPTLHPEWVNLDASAVSPGVIARDLRRGLPFPDNDFDATYGSHVLEHLEPDAALRLLRECHRILRPSGIVRIVVPDLEAIARLYLESLAGTAMGDADATFRYDWAMLELYDQTVRTGPGGRMAACLTGKLEVRQARFIEERIGAEAMRWVPASHDHRPALWRLGRCISAATRALRHSAAFTCAFLFLGPEGAAALREGLFRHSGEIHQWMYDRFSLKRALAHAGFADVRICAADDSSIPDFPRFGLETRDGRPRKPDSLYIEARKSGAA